MIGSFKVETPSLVLALRQNQRAREAEQRAEPSRNLSDPCSPTWSNLAGNSCRKPSGSVFVARLKLAFGALRTAEACVEALLRL